MQREQSETRKKLEMDQQRWELAKKVFDRGLQVPPEGREKWLEAACGTDTGIRREVEELLRAHDEAERATPAPGRPEWPEGFENDPDIQEEAAPGTTIGSYKILQEIGSGGFGLVYMAEQKEPVRRQVALKIIRLGMDTRQVIARFEAERQALALMDHPNIAKVFDAGATRKGRPYFVMELVKGIPITDYCDQVSMGTSERLKLFQQVCLAVQHAHQKGIIHRDLKPSNILVTLHDGRPVPKVIDFGIAKATNQRLTEKTLFTAFRQMIGTPEYMAPEQAEMSGLDLDTRADIYSLGVLLYELLTGTKPFDLATLLEAGYDEMLRYIREIDPPRPSTRVSTHDNLPSIARHRHTHPKLLGWELRGDLDWIVMKAMEKDRTRRYETASAFAMDVGRYLSDEEVTASPPSTSYRVRKFVRRHRTGVISGSLVVVALLMGMALALVGFLEARSESDWARIEARRANRVTDLIESIFASWDPAFVKGANYTARELLDEFDLRIAAGDAGSPEEPEVEAQLRRVAGNAYLALGIPGKAEPHLRRAYELGLEIHGADHPFVIDNRLNWAYLLRDKGEYEKAATVFRDVVARGERGMQSDALRGLANTLVQLARVEEAEDSARQALAMAPNLAARDSSKVDLAGVLGAREQLAEAEQLVREALESQERHLGHDHPEIVHTLDALASILGNRSKLREAEQCYRRSLDIWQRGFGRPNEVILLKLGSIRLMLGHGEEALELCEQAVELSRQRLGKNHRQTARALVQLGDVRRQQSDFLGAHALYEEALAILRSTIGIDNLEYAEVLRALAQAKERLGEYEEALDLGNELLALRERFFGMRSWPVARALHNLATTLGVLGREAEALPLQRRSLALHEELMPQDELGLAAKLNGLGILLTRLGQYAESKDVLERSLHLRRNHLGQKHDHVATTYNNLGHMYLNSTDLHRAVESLQEALAIYQEIHDGDHIQASHVLHNLGYARLRQEDYPSAIHYLERTLNVRRIHLGADHPDVATTLHLMMFAYSEAGQVARAMAAGDEASRIRRQALGPHQRETLRSLHAQGTVLFQSGRFAAAIGPLRTVHEHWPNDGGKEKMEAAVTLSFALRCNGDTEAAEALLERTLDATEVPRDAVDRLETAASQLARLERHREAECAARRGLNLARSLPGPRTASCESQVATLQFRLGTILEHSERPGALEEGEALLQASIDTRRRLHGEESIEHAGALASLASLFQSGGQLDQAAPLLERGIEIVRKLRGDGHPSLPELINNLGTVSRDLGRSEEAAGFFRDALARSRRIYGRNSLHHATYLANLAEVEQKRDRPDLAVPLWRECLDLFRNEIGAEDPRTLNCLLHYGIALGEAKQLTEARAACEKAMLGFREALGPDAPQVLWARMYLTFACRDLSDWHAVERHATDNLAAIERTIGIQNELWQWNCRTLALSLQRSNRNEMAVPLLRRNLAVSRKIATPIDLANDLIRLTTCLLDCGENQEAESLASEAIVLRDQHLPADHWHRYSARCLLGRSLAGQEKYPEAEKLLVGNYEKMKPPPHLDLFKSETRDAIVRMYEAWGKTERAEAWRRK